jgi:hypothetical protein
MQREMALDIPQTAQTAEVRLELGQAAAPGNPILLAFDLTDRATGQVVDKLQTTHEAPMHLVVVSYDMAYFAHLHPVQETPGRYTVTDTFPTAGDYVLYLEFAPAGHSEEVHRFDLPVGATGSAPAQLTPDLAPRSIDGVDASIAVVGADQVQSGQEAVFTVHLARDGQPVTDLHAYLGAAAHVEILNERAGGFAHVHAMAGTQLAAGNAGTMDGMEDMADEEAPPARFGPDITFAHTFPTAGLYKMWVQVAQGNNVITIPWVVEVK